MRVRTPDGGGDLHRGVAMQRLLDGRGIDVVPAADDELLLPPGEPEIPSASRRARSPVLSQRAPSPQSTQSPSFCVGSRYPAKTFGPRDDDDADLVDGAIANVSRLCRRATTALHLLARECEGRSSRPGARRAADSTLLTQVAFGQAVALQDPDPGALLERAKHLGRQRGGPAKAVLERLDTSCEPMGIWSSDE